MPNHFKEYFVFSKKERKGVYSLLWIIVILLTVKISMPYFISNESKLDPSFISKVKGINSSKAVKKPIRKFDIVDKFNPNNYQVNDWVEIGFTRKEAEMITNYKDVIKGFKSKKDIQKVYCISDSIFKQLESYLLFESLTENKIELKKTKMDKHSIPSGFSLNPNKATKENWGILGISEKQFKVINNYLIKGGKFQNEMDLNKMYVISAEWIESNSQYLRFEQGKIEASLSSTKQIINLNSADSATLVSIKGIGPYYSKLIINYREKLGGYISFTQLNEIEQLKEKTIDLLKDKSKINNTLIHKIDINNVDFKSLLKHPYIDYELTKALIKLRNNEDGIKDFEEFQNANFVYPELAIKLKPYFIFLPKNDDTRTD